MNRGLALWFALALILAAGSPAFGQPGFLQPGGRPAKIRPSIPLPAHLEPVVNPDDADRPRVPKYVKFDIEGNPEQMLADFLKSKAGQGLIKKLLEGDLQKLLEKPPGDIERVIKDKVGQGPFREFIEEFLKQNPGVRDGKIGGDDLRDAVKNFGEKIKDDPAFVEAIAKKMSKLDQTDGPKLPKLINNDAPELPDIDKLIEQENRSMNTSANGSRTGSPRTASSSFSNGSRRRRLFRTRSSTWPVRCAPMRRLAPTPSGFRSCPRPANGRWT